MLHPSVCQDERLRQYLQSFRALFSCPQYEHFVTVLMLLLLSLEGYTLSHLNRTISGIKSLSSLSRLEPLLYRQEKTAKKDGVPFVSKINLMIQQIRNFTSPYGTVTHVLLDSWYSAKKVWKAARDRGFQITTGLRCNRSLRVTCENDPKVWKWQKLSDYAASLPESAYQQCSNPRNPEQNVYVHVVDTRIKKLYRCKFVIVRYNLNDPISETRYWASSDLAADAQTLLGHISVHWEIEVFFGDTKELLGIDQYQVMTSTVLLCYWTLCWIAFSFLEEIRDELKHQKIQDEVEDQEECKCQPATLGQARKEVQKTYRLKTSSTHICSQRWPMRTLIWST